MHTFIFYTRTYGQVRVPGVDALDAALELIRRGYHNPGIELVRVQAQ